MIFVRPGELRTAEWAHIDLDRCEWRFRITKTDTHHLVPLAGQAVAILRELHALTGCGRYVFPGARSHERPMSGAAINAALRRMDMTRAPKSPATDSGRWRAPSCMKS